MVYTIISGIKRPIPKKYTFNDGSKTGNFDIMDEAAHNSEGIFYCIPEPEYDYTTHKLLAWERDGNNWVRTLVPLDTTDLEDIKQQKRELMTCSLLQLKKALNVTGKRSQVNSELIIADQDTKDAFECASVVKRLDPMVVAFGAKLGMTDEEMDDFIEMANNL